MNNFHDAVAEALESIVTHARAWTARALHAVALADGECGRMACSGGGLRGASSEPRCYYIL